MSQLPREPKVPSWHNTAASEAFAPETPGVAVNERPDPMSSNNQTPPRLFPQTI